MRKVLIALTAGLMAIPAALTCSTVESGPAGASVYASKTAFCGANNAFDRETANVDSASGFVVALRAHTHQLDVMKANLPSGAVGQKAKKLLDIAESVMKSGNPGKFFESAANSSGEIDTYCGVQGDGQPLPAYFKQGAKSSFCKAFLPVYNAISDAPGDATTLAELTSHETQINQLATEASTLPASIRTQATTALHTAQAAIAANSATPVASDTTNSAPETALYCGENE